MYCIIASHYPGISLEDLKELKELILILLLKWMLTNASLLMMMMNSECVYVLQMPPHANALCVRDGCHNMAVENPGWDAEYCSNECVVTHCR